MKKNGMTISLVHLADEHTIAFKEEMQEAYPQADSPMTDGVILQNELK